MMPFDATWRTWQFFMSAMYTVPEGDETASSDGSKNSAEVADPPLPEKPWVPLPANTLMIPVTGGAARDLGRQNEQRTDNKGGPRDEPCQSTQLRLQCFRQSHEGV